MLNKAKFITLKPLSEAPMQPWLDNRLQLFDIIEFCLREMGGNCHVIITTFSTSEEFIRKIFHFREENLVKSAVMLLDRKAVRKTMRLIHFMQNVFDKVYLTDNHSKIILMENDKWKVTICTSQNQTRGNRMESGILLTHTAIYDAFNHILQDMINNKTIDAYDIFCRTD